MNTLNFSKDKRIGGRDGLSKLFEVNHEEEALAEKRRQEKRAAEAHAFHAIAYRSMPEDLKESAERWGVSALAEAIFMNAFEYGYKQAMRDAASESEFERLCKMENSNV